MADLSWNRQHWTASVQLHRLRNADIVYGEDRGSPEISPILQRVRDSWLRPFVSPDRTIVELGPGGGRWTRYLLDGQRIYAVDISAAMLDELRERTGAPERLVCVETDGATVPGVPPGSVDFVFSFDTLTYLELDVVDAYLRALRPTLRPGADVVLQYANQDLAPAREHPYFGDADPRRIELLAHANGYLVVRHDTTLLSDSGLIHLRPWDDRPLPPRLAWPLDTQRPLRLLVWPDYPSVEDLANLGVRYVLPLLQRKDVTLCVRFDPRIDGPRNVAVRSLQTALERTAAQHNIRGETALEILLIESDMLRSDWPRLGRSVHGALVLPSSKKPGHRGDFLHAVQPPRLIADPQSAETFGR